MDFNSSYEELLAKYGLQNEEVLLNPAEKRILVNWESVPEDDRVAIWGAGNHTTEVLLKLVSLTDKKVICFIDKNPDLHGKTIMGRIILPPEGLRELAIETVVISSFAFRREIAGEIEKDYPHCRIVDLYEGVDAKYRPFYDHVYYQFYRELYFLQKKLGVTTEKKEKERCLRELLIRYLQIRDFVQAGKCLQSYISSGFDGAGDLSAFARELTGLLQEFKAVLKARKKPDIIVLLVDSWRGKDFFTGEAEKRMPFTKKLAKNSIVYTKVFSPSTYTRASFISILTGKMIIDDEFYQRNYVEFDESRLLCSLREQGFQFYQYGGIRIVKPGTLEQPAFIARGLSVRDKFEPVAKRLWDVLCDLAEEKVPVFSILHLMEAHWPFPSPLQQNYVEFDEHPGVQCYRWQAEGRVPIDKLENMKDQALRYLDMQFEFYSDFLGENTSLVMLGDHGQAIGEKGAFCSVFTWYDEVLWTPLIIHNKSYRPTIHDRIFSLKDFGRELLYVLEKGEPEPREVPFVAAQRDPIFDRYLLQNREFRERLAEKFFHGFKVFRTEREKYVLLDNGEEEYCLFPGETNNLIREEKYKGRIEYLRNQMDPEFPYLEESSSSLKKKGAGNRTGRVTRRGLALP